jgi:hypothetical protein
MDNTGTADHRRSRRPRSRRLPLLDLQPTRPARRDRTAARPSASRHPTCPRPPARLRHFPAAPCRARRATHPRTRNRQQAAPPSTRRSPRTTPDRRGKPTPTRHAEATSSTSYRTLLNASVIDTVRTEKQQVTTMIVRAAPDKHRTAERKSADAPTWSRSSPAATP